MFRNDEKLRYESAEFLILRQDPQTGGRYKAAGAMLPGRQY